MLDAEAGPEEGVPGGSDVAGGVDAGRDGLQPLIDQHAVPDASVPREITGIRPGEKLHEILITGDESRHAVDAGDVYVVLPEHPWWNEKGPGTLGRALPDDFVYASDTNTEWLSVPQLRSMLGELLPAA